MNSRVITLLAIIILLLTAGSVAGQGIDPLTDYVTLAADNLMQQDTALFEGASHVIMQMDMGGAAQVIEIDAEIDGQYRFAEGDFEAWYVVQDQAFSMMVPGAGEMAFDLTLESLMAEATLYERVTSESPMFASALPGGWTVVDDAAGTPAAGAMDPTAMMPGIDITKLPYLIRQDTIVTVFERNLEVVDDRPMRVFDVELDMAAVSRQMSAWMSGMPNDELSEEDAELAAGMMPGLFSEMEMTWTVWIDTTTDLPYRSAGTMIGPLNVGQPGAPQGMSVVMDMTLEFDMTFTEFNVPVEIEAPDMGS